MNLLKSISLLGLVFSINACTVSSVETIHQSVSAIPKIQETSLTKIRQCVANEITPFVNENNKGAGFVFMVNNISDGTIPEGYADGPLADSGKLQMLNSLQRLLNDNFNQVLVLGRIPAMFKEGEQLREGFLNELGYPHYNNIISLQKSLINTFNKIRKDNYPEHYHKSLFVDRVRFFTIDATFSRNDSDTTFVNGVGFSSEYNRKTQSELSIGNNNSSKFITLTLNIIDPIKNVVIASENFDLEFTNNKKEGEFKIGRNGISSGISVEKQVIESVHSAQQTLIDYASIWLINKITDQNISECITF